jgi:hypothetical protein
MYIYIYIEREREGGNMETHTHTQRYIYIYTETDTHREGRRENIQRKSENDGCEKDIDCGKNRERERLTERQIDRQVDIDLQTVRQMLYRHTDKLYQMDKMDKQKKV